MQHLSISKSRCRSGLEQFTTTVHDLEITPGSSTVVPGSTTILRLCRSSTGVYFTLPRMSD
jgi:hypothetical protein